jgi:hypothetical protein
MTTALEEGEGQRHALAALYHRERHGTHFTGGWLEPRAGLNKCGKCRPPPGFDPRAVQPVTKRYTEWDTGPVDIPSMVQCYSLHREYVKVREYSVYLTVKNGVIELQFLALFRFPQDGFRHFIPWHLNILINLLTAIGLSPCGSTHLNTNTT